MNKVREFKQDLKSAAEIKDSDLECITLEFDEEAMIMASLFDVGSYFNEYSQNIIKGVIPSAQFKRVQQDFSQTVLLVAFVPNFEAIFDSTNAVQAHNGEGAVDLRHTLQYKLLITCGTLIKVNKKTKTQVVWVEETRSVMLKDDEQKMSLCEAVGADQQVAENPDMMAIAIEFRLKPLVSPNSIAGASQGESKAYKQLK